MHATETTKQQTLAQVLKTIRSDFAGLSYISGTRHYDSKSGVLVVRNSKSADGGKLLGVFVAELTNDSGEVVSAHWV